MRKRLCWLFVAFFANQFIVNSTARGEDRPVAPNSAARSKPSPNLVEVREFEVRVDNRSAGTHRLAIKSGKANETVEFQTDVKVDVIVYAYVFKFRGTEIWRDGRLDDTEIRCEDGGKKRSFSLKTEGAIQQVAFNGKSVQGSPPVAMTTAYWKLPPAALRTKSFQIIDVDTGVTREATLSLVGPDTISSGGRSLACQHFKIDGPSPAELWFDDQDRLVHQKSLEQGHLMELKLQQIRISNDGN